LEHERTDPPKRNILIVDDAPANRALLSDILIDAGYTVRPVPGGPEALAEAEAAPPDLILLDIKMPGMDGYQVCQQLKADQRTSDIPIIFMSVLEETQDKIKAFDAGGADYLTKPFEFSEVLARIQTHLALRGARRQLQAANYELERRYREVKTYHDHLEEMVAERTAELRRTNGQLWQEIAARSKAEEELKQYRTHLEELVKRRTAELERSNHQLQAEIAERVRAEAQRDATLATLATIALQNARLYEQAQRDAQMKATLLHEVNHRVGNNLSVLIGLVEIEQSHAQSGELGRYQRAMENMASRLQGLAAVHRMLSASGWTPPRLDELSRRIIETVLKLVPADKDVTVEMLPSEVRVSPKQAHNLALVINELATNAVKYAWRERTEGRIEVRIDLEDDGEMIRFEFRDDGPGYAQDVLRLERHSVGFDLIRDVVNYALDGTLSLHNDAGAVAVVRFKAGVNDTA
jgi:DNA-binding response OmpR family regulator/septum formation topological specificity factor MinE